MVEWEGGWTLLTVGGRLLLRRSLTRLSGRVKLFVCTAGIGWRYRHCRIMYKQRNQARDI
jgi:hypothetical protein